MSGWLWLALALAAPEDALDDHWRTQYRSAQALEASGQLDDAARLYRMIRLVDPDFVQAVVDLGRVLEKAGKPGEAQQVYLSAPQDPDAVLALGRLQLALGHRRAALRSFEKVGRLRYPWPEVRVYKASALAADDPVRAAALLFEYLDFWAASPDDEGFLEVTEQVAVELRAQEGDIAPAVALIERLVARYEGDASAADAVERLRAMLVEFEIDETAEELAAAAEEPLAPAAVARLRAAREAFAEGDREGALRALEALVDDAPASAVAWAALSDLRAATGDLVGAEQAMRAAQQLDPLDAAYQARLGELLTEAYGPRYDAEAAEALTRAVRRRPNDAALWVQKARAERRAGSWAQAVASYRQALALDSDAAWAAEARRAVEGAARERPPDVALPSPPEPPEEVPGEAWDAFHRAWAWQERGDSARALEEVERTRDLAPSFVRAVNLEAGIRADLGDPPTARELYRQSLALDPTQAEVLAVLAELEAQAGNAEEAAQLWARAAELGEPGALWRLAARQAERRQWWSARKTLDRYFARTTRHPDYAAALALDEELARTTQLAVGVGTALGVLAVGLPVGWLVRRRLGVGLPELLARAPRAWPDVARICSAIRHEVLKHHTSVLPSVADALEQSDPDPARWAADRLFGESGALEQLDAYVAELEAVGRRAGVDLNLRYADPTFRPMLTAVERLRALEPELRHAVSRGLADALRDLAEELNGRAYAALGELIAELSVLDVDEALVRSVWQQIEEEPAFLGHVLPEFTVQGADEPLWVRIYPTDLRDILANLLRNAVEVSLQTGLGRIGVDLRTEEDPITGLERVQIRVLDMAPSRLTTAMIRGRYISRGLGLAADLTSRAGGAIHVEDAPGWSKAVVVRLPRAERRQG